MESTPELKRKEVKERKIVKEQNEIGPVSDKYKYYALVLIIIQTISSQFGAGFSFYELVPTLECKTTSNEWISCSKSEACGLYSDYRIDWSSEYSIQNMMTNLELICEDDYLIGLIGSIVFIGVIISSFTIMPTPDIFGRKPILLLCSTICSLSPFLCLFAKSLLSIYILMFLFGLSTVACSATAYVYVLELVPKEKSKFYVAALILSEKLLCIQVSPIMYLFQDWKFNIVYFSIVSSICTILLIWVPESPMYLKNKAKDSSNNQKGSWLKRLGSFKLMVEERSGSNHTNEKSFIQMLKEKSNCINLLIIVFAWSVTGYSYYCVAFYVKYFNGSIYINAFLFGLAELIGVFIFSFLIKYFKNKTLFIGLFFLSFIGSICYCLTRTYTDLVPIWILLMAISFSMLFSLVYYANCSFFSSEYSTRIFSICNVVSRSFTILAPMSVETFSNPIIFVCMLSLFLSLISFLLKESEQSKSEGE